MGMRLTPQLLIQAYRQGVFPMADESSGEISWYSPNPRGIIPLDERFHIPKRLARTWRSQRYSIRYDASFRAVMQACAQPRPGQPTTWISQEFIDVYAQLHQQGHAHSVEVWEADRLVGGLYGVSMGALFAGESMFSTARDASKIALIALVLHLRRSGFELLDTQWVTEHLAQFGAFWMPRAHYIHMLERIVNAPVRWLPPESTSHVDVPQA